MLMPIPADTASSSKASAGSLPGPLGQDLRTWAQLGAFHTATEVAQQGRLWADLALNHLEQGQSLRACLQPWLARSDAQVILTGAGSSAYVGQVVAEAWGHHHRCRVRAVATTDLLSHPGFYLSPTQPTLLVSFARSGSSPESLGAVELVRALVQECAFLHITCNPEGELAMQASHDARTHTWLMPQGSCDQGFAMTSSFTCMLLAGLAALSPQPLSTVQAALQTLAEQAEPVLQASQAWCTEVAQSMSERVLMLADGALLGVAREAALKLLELTAGRVACWWETPLGLRHGPKALLDAETLVLVWLSRDPHARRYALDLVEELRRDGVARVLTIGEPAAQDAGEAAPDWVLPACPAMAEAWMAPLGLLLAQQWALYRSVAMGFNPDNPFPAGQVNRVVKGVRVYPYRLA
jgi:tagatose-6-phosphate ketose/aldose isomerase